MGAGKCIETWALERLGELRDDKYASFNSSLLPGVGNILGVKIPELRRMARMIARMDGWQDFVRNATANCFEITMLRGLVLGYAKTDLDTLLELLSGYVPLIDNWAVCDCVCSTLAGVKCDRARVWDFLMPFLVSDEEFRVRFGVVMLMDYFADETYAPKTLNALDGVGHSGYYAQMGVAWAVSVLYVRYPDMVRNYLKDSRLDDFTFNKSIRKIIESRRVDASDKELLRKMIRK